LLDNQKNLKIIDAFFWSSVKKEAEMRVAINGFGRIGRAVFKIALENNIDVIAINDIASTENLAYLLKYDSIYGNYNKKVEVEKEYLIVERKKVQVLNEKDPAKLPWKKLGVDFVIESTGLFTAREDAAKHLAAGAKKVLISAPAKNSDITVVPGVNEEKLNKKHNIISIASCTTNCLAPIVKILNDKCKIVRGFMTTIHAYTADQRLQDAPHKKMRRGRAAALSMVPTTTGASKAVAEVIPELKGKLDGLAIRVPVACGSIVDFVAQVKKPVTREKINDELKESATGRLNGILQYSEEELVSSDIIGNPHSCIVDGLSTQVLDDMVKVLAWYDNEYGYSCRMVDVIKLLAGK
jgi:glyceraldehyde 3-phosphate dehydrogenase